MVRIFSNDPTAFLRVEHPVSAWNEMLSREEKAVFRDIMAILASHCAQPPLAEGASRSVVLALEFEFTKIVQTLYRFPNTDQLERINQRFKEYEVFLGDCIFKMHSQLNEFMPKMASASSYEESLEAPQSLQTHTRLKDFEEQLMKKIANLSQQIGTLGESFLALETLAQATKPFWQRWLAAMISPFVNSPLALNRDLMQHLEKMQHSLVQDYARLGTLWRYYNQHQVLRKLGGEHQTTVLDFCRKAYWREFKGGWSAQTLIQYTEAALPALRRYESAIGVSWKDLYAGRGSALSLGLEQRVDDFALELQDLIITLGKYGESYQSLSESHGVTAPPQCFAYQELLEINRRMHGISHDVQQLRAEVHPVLNDLHREAKEKVLALAAWIGELDLYLADRDRFQEESGMLFEALEHYMDRIHDEVGHLLCEIPSTTYCLKDLGRRHRQKYEAYQLELQDLFSAILTLKVRYQDLLTGDMAIGEDFGAAYHDLNATRLDQMIGRVEGISARLVLG